MDKLVILTALMGLVLAASVFQAFELNGLKSQLSAKTGAVTLASAPQSAASSGDAAYDQMMREMHPDQFAQQQAASAAIGGNALGGVPNQVGGC